MSVDSSNIAEENNFITMTVIIAIIRVNQGCICRGGGVEPPRKFLTPLLLLKKRKGGATFYALARSSTLIAKTSTPLMKFDKYSPGVNVIYNKKMTINNTIVRVSVPQQKRHAR